MTATIAATIDTSQAKAAAADFRAATDSMRAGADDMRKAVISAEQSIASLKASTEAFRSSAQSVTEATAAMRTAVENATASITKLSTSAKAMAAAADSLRKAAGGVNAEFTATGPAGATAARSVAEAAAAMTAATAAANEASSAIVRMSTSLATISGAGSLAAELSASAVAVRNIGTELATVASSAALPSLNQGAMLSAAGFAYLSDVVSKIRNGLTTLPGPEAFARLEAASAQAASQIMQISHTIEMVQEDSAKATSAMGQFGRGILESRMSMDAIGGSSKKQLSMLIEMQANAAATAVETNGMAAATAAAASSASAAAASFGQMRAAATAARAAVAAPAAGGGLGAGGGGAGAGGPAAAAAGAGGAGGGILSGLTSAAQTSAGILRGIFSTVGSFIGTAIRGGAAVAGIGLAGMAAAGVASLAILSGSVLNVLGSVGRLASAAGFSALNVGIRGLIAGLALLWAAWKAGKELFNFAKEADEASLLNSRILALGTTYSALSATAHSVGAQTKDLVKPFESFTAALEPMKASGQQIETAFASATGALRLIGVVGSEATQRLEKLSTAFKDGKITIREFATIEKDFPTAMQAVMDASGRTELQLRQMASDGTLSAHLLAKAFVDTAASVQSQVLAIPRTIAQATAESDDAWSRMLGRLKDTGNITAPWIAAIDKIKGLFSNWHVAEMLGDLVSIAGNVASGIASAFVGLVSVIAWHWTTVKDIVSSAFKYIIDVAVAPINYISTLITGQPVKWKVAFDYIVDGFKVAGYAASVFANILSTVVGDAFTSITNAARSAFDFIFTGLAYIGGAITQIGVSMSALSHGDFSGAKDALLGVNEAGAKSAAQFLTNIDVTRKLAEANDLLTAAAVAANRAVLAGATDLPKVGKPPGSGGIMSDFTKKGTDKGGDSARQKLAVLQEQNTAMRTQLEGDIAATHEAQLELDIRKNVTEAMKKNQPVLAAEIEAQIRLNDTLKLQLETFQALKGLGTELGNDISNAFMAIGDHSKTASQAMREMLATMIKQVAQALILKPLINQMSSSFAGALTPAFGTSLSSVGGGVLSAGGSGGMLSGLTKAFDGFGNTVSTSASGWQTSITNSSGALESSMSTGASTLTASGATTSASLQVGGTTAATSLEVGGTTTAAELEAGGAAAGAGSAAASGGGGLAGLFSGLFNANGNAFGPSGVLSVPRAFAMGGAFDGQHINVKAFAAGGVFNKPTGFSFGGGQLGVLGEAGPEAIMPLSHSGSGGFGIKAHGPGGSMVLPLTRGPDGKMAVRMFADGAAFGGSGEVGLGNGTPYTQMPLTGPANSVAQTSGATPTMQTNIYVNGDVSSETITKIAQAQAQAVADQRIAMAAPKIIQTSVDSVAARNRSDRTFLARR